MSPNDKIIRLRQVMEQTGMKKTTIYEKIKKHEFPEPIRLGSNFSGWLESDVQAWIRKVSGRDPANDDQPRAA